MCDVPKIDPEFKTLIPPLSPDEREQLEQNILSHGCKNALVLWNGTIIDGHNRLEICVEHGVEFEIVEMEFSCREGAKLWILNEQLGRRNLNDATRIEIALKKKELLREQAQKKQSAAGGDKTRGGTLFSKSSERLNTHKTLADEAGVSDGTLHNYLQIKKDGDPTLIEKVQSGELKIGTAHKMLGAQMINRLKFCDKTHKYIAKHAPEDDKEVNTRLAGLKNLLDKLIEKVEGVKNAKNQP